jgi:hypothetical protein
MSWLYSRALVEEYSAATCSDGEPSAPLNGNPTQLAYLQPDKMTAFSRLSRFGMTFKPLTDDRGEELLTLYLAAFHAKTSAPQERGQESTESDPGCGHIWQELLARYDQSTSLWRTPQCSLLGDYTEFSETWPKWGLMQDGVSYQRQTLVRPTSETESGLRLPTPLASDHKKLTRNKEYHLNRHYDLPNKIVQLGHPPSKNGAWGFYHPILSESMMGWPLGWTDLKPLGMDKYQHWLQQHGVSSNEET